MNKNRAILVVMLIVAVSLSGCLGRGGNGDHDARDKSPEDVDGDD